MLRSRFLPLVPHALALLAASYLLLITPTLNYDDLQIVTRSPAAIASGWGKTLFTLLFNLDLGTWQPRTYGLARALQYTQAWFLGANPPANYAVLLALHFGSGLLAYAIVKRSGGDALTAIFAAIIWVASPSVLPLLKTEHHFLYLIAPYYPLFGWLLYSARRDQDLKTFLVGSLLLGLAWMLGEGVVIPIFVAVLAFTLDSGSIKHRLSLFGQGVVAGVLCVSYVGYQVMFLSSSDHESRFHLASKAGAFGILLHDFGQNVRGILGLSYYDSSLGMILGGFGVLRSLVFWMIVAVLVVFGLAAARSWPRSNAGGDRRLALTIGLVAVSSIVVPALFVLMGMGTFLLRYNAAFFALVPFAVVALAAAYGPRPAARYVGVVLAALSVGLMVGSLQRAEQLVSAPNRDLLASLQGRVVLLRPRQRFDPKQYGAIPGLAPIDGNGLANPMRSLWTAGPALKLYAGAVIANECRMVAPGRVEVYLMGRPLGQYAPKDLLVMGSELTVAQACDLAR